MLRPSLRLILLMLLAALALLMLLSRPVDAQPSVVTFHPSARASIERPPEAERLRVACTRERRAAQTPLGAAGWFSLLAPTPDSAVWMIAFTRRRIGRVSDVISTTPRWSPMPTAKPTASGTLDWAWIWDRNGDGRVDYFAYLQNAHALLPDPVPDTLPLPSRNPDGSVRVTLPLLHAIIDNSVMVFRHYADEDFDGRVDAAIVEEFDALRPMFVRGWVVARASRQDGVVDQAWAFRRGITDSTRAVTADAGGVIRIPALNASGPTTEPAAERLAYATGMLGAINELVVECGPSVVVRRP